MKSKKNLVCISAIMILIYHLWVPIFNNNIEKYIRYICYIGVDIFFFVSAYSLSKRKINYNEFIKNRFVNIYFKFVIFLLIAAIYKKYGIVKIISILTGYEFIIKGGGSFLWFIPSIMILYVIIPLYKKVDNKLISPIIFLIIWLTFTILVSLYTNYNSIFIFTNRIPIFMIGYYMSKYNVLNFIEKNRKRYYFCTLSLLILGTLVSYISYNYHIKLSFINDAYYLFNIPLILGIIFFINEIPDNIITNNISKVSLELYAFQMIFGFRLVNKIFMNLNNSIITNISVFAILFLISYVFNLIFKKIVNMKDWSGFYDKNS